VKVSPNAFERASPRRAIRVHVCAATRMALLVEDRVPLTKDGASTLRAQVVLLLGRCRFVTASTFQFCFVKFCQELSVHLATIPRRATRTAPLALPHHEWLPLENAAQFAAPCEGEDQVSKMTFNLLLAFAEQSTDTFSK
jgi:hypothetical protein